MGGLVGSGKCFDIDIALAHRLAKLNVADAQATSQDDHQMIVKLINEEGGMEEMNRFIRGNMLHTLEEAKKKFNQEIDTVQTKLGFDQSWYVDQGHRGFAET